MAQGKNSKKWHMHSQILESTEVVRKLKNYRTISYRQG